MLHDGADLGFVEHRLADAEDGDVDDRETAAGAADAPVDGDPLRAPTVHAAVQDHLLVVYRRGAGEADDVVDVGRHPRPVVHHAGGVGLDDQLLELRHILPLLLGRQLRPGGAEGEVRDRLHVEAAAELGPQLLRDPLPRLVMLPQDLAYPRDAVQNELLRLRDVRGGPRDDRRGQKQRRDEHEEPATLHECKLLRIASHSF